MYIARTKRKENIAEYILYLWQLEDLLRAVQFSPEAVYTTLVKPMGLESAQEQTALMWYMEIAGLLTSEGKEQGGHLDHTLHLITDLHNLHLQLLKLPVGERYRERFALLEPELDGLRTLLAESKTIKGEVVSDTELSFRALYAAMLYRIGSRSGKEGPGNDSVKIAEQVVELVSPVVAELASVFHKGENGEIDLFEETV